MNVLKMSCLAAGFATLSLGSLGSTSAQADEWSANVSAHSNYIWRGLTQSQNEAAISGGIDYAHDSGFYIGTWASNVSYAPADDFSYEHDIYLGYGGAFGDFEYDVGYLYYNYDNAAEFDFGEIYGSISTRGFTLGVNLLTNTEADEGPGQDFGFGRAVYAYVDYGTTIGNEIDLGVHFGFHEGDFNEAFNGVPGSYFTYNVSIAKAGFSFMISDTDLDGSGSDGLDNDSIKFTVGYTYEIGLSK